MSASIQDLIAEAVHEQADNEHLECREASPLSRETFIPCCLPAARFILSERGTRVYPMCKPCAYHNVKNRGAVDVGEAKRS